MGKPLVSVIIVNWNGGEMLRQCLISLSKIDYFNWELILVDNGSTDHSTEELKNLKTKKRVTRSETVKNIKIIQNKENVGFAGANNQGYGVSKGKYILLLNNDTTVTSNFLSYLVDEMEKDSTLGVIQPKIKIMDKPSLLDNSGAFLTRTGFLEHWGYMAKDSTEFKKEREVFSTKGACMLIRRSVVEKVGLFDPDFVSYMEETDFCFRVWLLGYKVMFVPEVAIYHKVGFTSKRQNQIFVNYHSFKNRLVFLIKNLEPTNLFIIGGFHLLLITTLSFYYLIKLQFSKAFMIWRAIWWNVINLPSTLKKRASMQKIRNVSDREIFMKVLHPINWRKMFAHFSKVEANF